MHDFEDIKGVAPNPDELASIGKELTQLREEAGDYPVEQGMAIPKLPCWGQNNDPDPEKWSTINDLKILCPSYQHEVEEFLKTVLLYFPRGSKSDDDFLEPCTPSSVAKQNTSASELPAPQHSKVQRFGDEENDIPPISTITSQGRLTALLEDDALNTPLNKVNLEKRTNKENPFSDEGISKEPKKFIPVASRPPGPPSDNSGSDSNS